jgi:hypothetical protein
MLERAFSGSHSKLYLMLTTNPLIHSSRKSQRGHLLVFDQTGHIREPREDLRYIDRQHSQDLPDCDSRPIIIKHAVGPNCKFTKAFISSIFFPTDRNRACQERGRGWRFILERAVIGWSFSFYKDLVDKLLGRYDCATHPGFFRIVFQVAGDQGDLCGQGDLKERNVAWIGQVMHHNV